MSSVRLICRRAKMRRGKLVLGIVTVSLGCALCLANAPNPGSVGPNREARDRFVGEVILGDVERLRIMPRLLNARDHTGETALFKAAWTNQIAVARFLLARGADVDAGRDRGTLQHPAGLSETPISIAIGKGRREMTELLLEHDADVTAGSDAKPLDRAVAKQDKELAARLIKLGADVNAKSGTWVSPPIHWPARQGHPEMVAWLLERGADPNATDRDGKTALHFAAEAGDVEAISALLKAGAKLEVGGVTPLHLAASNGKLDAVRRLLDGGADAKARSPNGATTIIAAATKRPRDGGGDAATKIAIMELLVKAGADPAAKSKQNVTALHAIVPHGSVEVAKWLLDHGVEINARRTDVGETALRATRHWRAAKELREYLKKRGAKE